MHRGDVADLACQILRQTCGAGGRRRGASAAQTGEPGRGNSELGGMAVTGPAMFIPVQHQLEGAAQQLARVDRPRDDGGDIRID